jgi:hypothetical protein
MTSTTTTRTRVDRMDMFSKFFISSILVATKVEIKLKNQNQHDILWGKKGMI